MPWPDPTAPARHTHYAATPCSWRVNASALVDGIDLAIPALAATGAGGWLLAKSVAGKWLVIIGISGLLVILAVIFAAVAVIPAF